MGYEVVIRSDGGLLVVFEGQVSLEDTEAARKAATGGDMSKFSDIPYILVDYSGATDVLHSAEDVRNLATSFNLRIREHNPDILVVFVAPKDLTFGMARMFHAYTGGGEGITMVRGRDEAEAWLKKTLDKDKE